MATSTTRRHSRNDPPEDFRVGIGVGVVEFQRYVSARLFTALLRDF